MTVLYCTCLGALPVSHLSVESALSRLPRTCPPSNPAEKDHRVSAAVPTHHLPC